MSHERRIQAAIRVLRAQGVSEGTILDMVCAMLEVPVDTAPIEHLHPASADPAAEKRRAWDRERKAARKRNSTGIPPEHPSPSPSPPAPPQPLPLPPPPSKENPPKGGQKKGARLPEGWEPSEADLQAARSEGLSEAQARREARMFRDHWIAKPGADALKLDWSATWRNWCRRTASRLGLEPDRVHDPPRPAELPLLAPVPPEEQERRIRQALTGGNWITRLWGPCPPEIAERVRVL